MSVNYHSEGRRSVLHDERNFHCLASVIHITRSVPTSQSIAMPATREMQPMHGAVSCRLVTTFLYTHKAPIIFIRLCVGTLVSFFTYFVPIGCQRHAQHRIKQTVVVIRGF